MANATLGVMASASLAIHAIGQGLAQARGKLTKHAVKQGDRLLSNQGVAVWALFAHWVPYVEGARTATVVAMGWTNFDLDGQATIMLSHAHPPWTSHAPGCTVDKATLIGAIVFAPTLTNRSMDSETLHNRCVTCLTIWFGGHGEDLGGALFRPVKTVERGFNEIKIEYPVHHARCAQSRRHVRLR